VYQTEVTVVGNVVDSPRRVSLSSGGAVTNFRMASTGRRYDTAKQEFVDDKTLWIDVECWNALSGNVSASVSKGDPVIVHGLLFTHEWESEAGPRSKPRIKAFAVGPNLSKGRSLFTRDRSGRTAEPAEAAETFSSSSDGAPDEQFSTSGSGLEAGRDYEVEGEALYGTDAEDLSREPAHA
jgi:single-strand DNA-binding protein